MIENVKKNDIVYFLGNDMGHKYVQYGMVDDVFSDGAVIDLLEVKETRLVNGVPIDDIPYVGEWKKLPKNWSWDTELFKLENEAFPMELKFVNIFHKDNIRIAYEKGWLVKAKDKFQGNVYAEIASHKGYRIVKKYPQYEHKIVRKTIPKVYLYGTSEEAICELEKYNKKLERQANLTDREWSLELIEEVVGRYLRFHDLPMDYKPRYMKFFEDMENLEDIECRMAYGCLEYKHWKNKRWQKVPEME